MISFDNTENAFRARSNAALNRSYWLFKLIGSPLLVNIGAALAPFSLKFGFKPLIKSTIFRQFVGGENIQSCAATIKELAAYNIGTILDYSVEGKENEADFENCVRETLATINEAHNNANMPFCVFKVTGLARMSLLGKVSSGQPLSESEKSEWQRVISRVNLICTTARDKQQAIFIDAEESWIQNAIDTLAEESMEKCNRENVIVYNTYQLYRTDRLQFLSETIERAKSRGYKLGAKLVRGAYMEKERKRACNMGYQSPIQPDKTACDADYDKAIDLCVENAGIIALCAGTHNEKSSMRLVELMQKRGFAPNDKRFYFSQLYGMSDHISFNLSLNGYNVAKYVPYGPVKEVLPYLIRRAQENTSVKGQTGRELKLIIKEKSRRKNANPSR